MYCHDSFIPSRQGKRHKVSISCLDQADVLPTPCLVAATSTPSQFQYPALIKRMYCLIWVTMRVAIVAPAEFQYPALIKRMYCFDEGMSMGVVIPSSSSFQYPALIKRMYCEWGYVRMKRQ